MKQKTLMIAATTIVAALTASSRADVFTDTVGDEFTGNAILDITSVEVTNNFTDLIFKINLNGNPVATDWGKYCMGFHTGDGGDTTANGNGWGRSISMTQGMNYWVGTWVDGTMGAQLYNYTGSGWAGPNGASVSKTTNSVTINVPFSGLGKTFGDSVDFDVYTTGGGGGDPAIDSLANPAQTVSSWSTPYASSLVRTYTIQTVGATTNRVSFLCNMEVPIHKFDLNPSSTDSFNTNSDVLYVSGSFNGWATTPAGYNLIQVGPTLFSNTVDVVATLGDTVSYKFEGNSFPGYENPVLTGGGNRSLTITNVNMKAPYAFFGDLALSNGTSTVTFSVDMSLQILMGLFDPSANGVSLPGNFNNWGTGAQPLTPGDAPNTNIYSTTLSYDYYPHGPGNVGFYKFFITSSTVARDGGWEDPIGTSSGNRAFAITASTQTNLYFYNDENPNFKATSVQKLDADSAKITWEAFPRRNNIPTGGVYSVESRPLLNGGTWTEVGIVTNTTTSASASITNSGLTGAGQQFYRVSLKALVP